MAMNDYRFVRNIHAWFRQRAENDVFDLSGLGAPISGAGTNATGVGLAGPTSTYRDVTNANTYVNLNTKASPQWALTAGSGGAGASATGLFLRSRLTVAAVNAGATLLPAVPGMKYRIIDIKMIAIGGAVAGATLVRVMGTQAAAAVALVGVAIAALTQSAVVRMGAANATVLADGASFNQCDVNTPILADKTGAPITGATFIEYQVSYVLER